MWPMAMAPSKKNLCGCAIGDCHYRTGNRRVSERVDGERRPVLCEKTRPMVEVYLSSMADRKEAAVRINAFAEKIRRKEEKCLKQVG